MDSHLTDDLIRLLQPIEPDLVSIAIMGSRILPALKEIAAGADRKVAASAISIAGMIGGHEAIDVVAVGLRSAIPELQVASAAAARGLPIGSVDVDLRRLLASDDQSVKKWAARAAKAVGGEGLIPVLDAVQASEVSDSVRAAAAAAIDGIRARR